MPKAANKNRFQFQVGMIVDCETTYRKFQGRVVHACGQPLYHPGDQFIVLNLSDGQEYPVSEYCMKRVIGSGPEVVEQEDTILAQFHADMERINFELRNEGDKLANGLARLREFTGEQESAS